MNNESSQYQNEENTIGSRLRDAREQLGLSQQEVANQLFLKVSVIRDIEKDRIPSGLVSTFFRGYIRSYAKLVRIPDKEKLLLTLANKNDVISMKSFSIEKNSKKNDKWIVYFAYLILFVTISLTGVWWKKNHKIQYKEIIDKVSNQSSTKLNQQLNKKNELSIPSIGSNSSFSTEKELKQSLQFFSTFPEEKKHTIQKKINKNYSVESISSDLKNGTNHRYDNFLTSDSIDDFSQFFQKNKVSFDNVTKRSNLNLLEIDFDSECWIEINDAIGKKLFSGLQRKNDNLFVSGKTPYQIKINIPNAIRKIQFQGKLVDMNRFIEIDHIAHLVLYSD